MCIRDSYNGDANVLRNANQKDTLPSENLNAQNDTNSADESKVQINENYANCAEVLRTSKKGLVTTENQNIQMKKEKCKC